MDEQPFNNNIYHNSNTNELSDSHFKASILRDKIN